MTALAATTATFNADVLDSDLPALVEFWTTLGRTCRQVAPVLTQLAAELTGRRTVVKVDIDANPQLARTFRR